MEMNSLLVNLLAITAIIGGLAIGAWWIMGLYSVHSRRQEAEFPEVDLPANLHEVLTGAPLALVVFYVFMAIALVGYVLYVWLGGITY